MDPVILHLQKLLLARLYLPDLVDSLEGIRVQFVSNVSDTNWGFGMFNSGSTYYPTVYFAAGTGDGDNRGFRVRNVSTSTNVLFVNSVGTLTASGDVVAYSDIRFKENIRPIENALGRITKSRGIFHWVHSVSLIPRHTYAKNIPLC